MKHARSGRGRHDRGGAPAPAPDGFEDLPSRRFARNVLLSITGGLALALAGQATAHAQDAGTASEGDGAATATATAIFQDISDQKRLDTLNARAERLEAVAELSASLAHEIKNPLAAIRSAVETLGRSPRSNADERTLADLIVRESDRLSRLLSEFLDFARVRVACAAHDERRGHTRTTDMIDGWGDELDVLAPR